MTGRAFLNAGYAAGQSEALAVRTAAGAVGVQSQLLTDMAIFRLFAFVLFVTLVLIIVVPRIYAFFVRPPRIT